MDTIHTIIQLDLSLKISLATNPIAIAEMRTKYELLQNYIDDVPLVELQDENFEYAAYRFESTLRMLKYFTMCDYHIRHSIYFKYAPYSNSTVRDNEDGNFYYHEYIMFFLRHNLNINLNYINISSVPYLYSSKFIADLLFVLENNNNIEKFVLNDKNQFSVDCVNKIINILPKLRITKLVMYTRFNNETNWAINNFLSNNARIKIFGLHDDGKGCINPILLPIGESIQCLTLNCAIDDNLFARIIDILNKNQLTKLDLSYSRLDQRFMRPLCQEIATNTKLTHLNLSCMGITQIDHIIAFLATNKVLECVNLSYNPICKNKYELMLHLLNNDSMRTYKIMSHTFFDIRHESLKLFYDVLRMNTALEILHINIVDGKTSGAIMDAIALSLDDNSTMKEIEIMNVTANTLTSNSKLIKIRATIDKIMKRNRLLQHCQTKSARKI